MTTPRLEIDLKKVRHNTKWLVDCLELKGVSVMGVTKVALGSPDVARSMINAGVGSIGDSRIENIQRMHEADVQAQFILIRSPIISKIDDVVAFANVSFNTELETLQLLSKASQAQGKMHQVVLMIELGDLREGILPENLGAIVSQTLDLPNIRLLGIGTNLACLWGVRPDTEKMTVLTGLAKNLELKFDLKLEMVSGGNSANLPWLFGSEDTGEINNLRLGESIFLGCETLNRDPIEGLHVDAVSLVAEVIESKVKPSVPTGDTGQNAFGSHPGFSDGGVINHSLLGIGRQDVLVSGLVADSDSIEILGSSSDHMVVASKNERLRIGDEVTFQVDYGALLTAMTSPFVEKVYLNKV